MTPRIKQCEGCFPSVKVKHKSVNFRLKKDVQRSFFHQSNYFAISYLKLRFSLSYRDIQELFSIRGIKVVHAIIKRWFHKFSPIIEVQMKKRSNFIK